MASLVLVLATMIGKLVGIVSDLGENINYGYHVAVFWWSIGSTCYYYYIVIGLYLLSYNRFYSLCQKL